jgi:hypothetical protein
MQLPLTLLVVTLVVICFVIDALMAMAPLTGSELCIIIYGAYGLGGQASTADFLAFI